MITLQDILESQSSILDGTSVKLVRHKDGRKAYRDVVLNRDRLLEYQREQGRDIFAGCDYIVSFIGLERKRSLLFGVFKVGERCVKDGKFYYDLTEVSDFSDLADRVIIDWGDNARMWHQWYPRSKKEVTEILPGGYIGDFPGLLNFVLGFDELRKLVRNPDANYEWYRHLSAVNGIYLILDNKTGRQYIGAAYGNRGIWGRWCGYAVNGTGENTELKTLLDQDPAYHRHFRFSVLQTLPSNVTGREVVAFENHYKEKLGSRAHGLNLN